MPVDPRDLSRVEMERLLEQLLQQRGADPSIKRGVYTSEFWRPIINRAMALGLVWMILQYPEADWQVIAASIGLVVNAVGEWADAQYAKGRVALKEDGNGS